MLPHLGATNYVFRGASGERANDFWLLARTASTSQHAPSLVVHVVDGVIDSQRNVDEPLNEIHVGKDGTIWGLTTTHAVRISSAGSQTFPLARPTHGRPWWYGIGGGNERVLVWGAGALLEFDGRGFVPFEPDAMLDDSESVVALVPHGLRLSMLVCGDRMGAVARFDSVQWTPIGEEQVIDASLADLDVFKNVAYVLDREGKVWKVDRGLPRPLDLQTRHQAFLTEAGTPRPFYAVRAYDGGVLLASNGGVLIASSGGEPVFHSVQHGRDPVRLVRVGEAGVNGVEAGIVAACGPNAWLWARAQLLRARHPRPVTDVDSTRSGGRCCESLTSPPRHDSVAVPCRRKWRRSSRGQTRKHRPSGATKARCRSSISHSRWRAPTRPTFIAIASRTA